MYTLHMKVKSICIHHFHKISEVYFLTEPLRMAIKNAKLRNLMSRAVNFGKREEKLFALNLFK